MYEYHRMGVKLLRILVKAASDKWFREVMCLRLQTNLPFYGYRPAASPNEGKGRILS